MFERRARYLWELYGYSILPHILIEISDLTYRQFPINCFLFEPDFCPRDGEGGESQWSVFGMLDIAHERSAWMPIVLGQCR
jgi:hypothetical protein